MKSNFSGTVVYSVITIALLAIVVIPIPGILLDFLITLNIILSMLLLCDIMLNKKRQQRNFSLPNIYLALSVYNLAITVAIIRLIMTLGEYFDSFLIRLIGYPFMLFGNYSLIAGLLFLVALLAAQIFFFSGKAFRASESETRINLEKMAEKAAVIEDEYTRGLISIEEIALVKNNLLLESDYYHSLNSACRFMYSSDQLRVLFVLIISIGGYFVGTKLRGEITGDAIENYFSLAIGSGILLVIPAFLLSLSLRYVAGKRDDSGIITE